MKQLILSIGSIVLVGCNSSDQIDVEQKAREFSDVTKEIQSGSEFELVAKQNEFECYRQEVSNSASTDIDELSESPDQMLNCIWTEDTSDRFSVVVYGSIQAVVYLASDQIITKEIETIYTGP